MAIWCFLSKCVYSDFDFCPVISPQYPGWIVDANEYIGKVTHLLSTFLRNLSSVSNMSLKHAFYWVHCSWFVANLEKGDLSLEESVAKFEEEIHVWMT